MSGFPGAGRVNGNSITSQMWVIIKNILASRVLLFLLCFWDTPSITFWLKVFLLLGGIARVRSLIPVKSWWNRNIIFNVADVDEGLSNENKECWEASEYSLKMILDVFSTLHALEIPKLKLYDSWIFRNKKGLNSVIVGIY